jgi:bis(5'-nucleosyl)-tetraphosphatase (symmetrical)
MSDYFIGDVQGCFDSLQSLLKKIKFSSDKDQLFFLGDVVNRGDKSLATLRFIKDLDNNAKMILGNHDFHLLACALTSRKPNSKDTFTDILRANDRDELIGFLLKKPLAIKHKDALLVHAGVPPIWDQEIIFKQSALVQKYLQGDDVSSFLSSMYDNEPNKYHNDLDELDACRYTINALMRMRFCKSDGELEFDHKVNYDQAPEGYKAWFLHSDRKLKNTDIFFGHWSDLANVNQAHVYPMDHGCIWSGALSAIRLEDRKIFSVNC